MGSLGSCLLAQEGGKIEEKATPPSKSPPRRPQMSTHALTYAEARKLWPQPVATYTLSRQLSWVTPSITIPSSPQGLSWALAKTKPTTYAEARRLCNAAKNS